MFSFTLKHGDLMSQTCTYIAHPAIFFSSTISLLYLFCFSHNDLFSHNMCRSSIIIRIFRSTLVNFSVQKKNRKKDLKIGQTGEKGKS